MAIDSRNKRGSVIGFKAGAVPLFPNPDGAITQPDRQQLAREYSGLQADAPVEGGAGHRRRRET